MTLAPARPAVRWRGSVAVGLVLALLYCALSTWSIGAGYGGTDSDGGWTDSSGTSTSDPPIQVQVVSHPSIWVLLALGAVLFGGVVLARRATDVDVARRRLALSVATATVLVLAALLVFSGLQSWLVGDAIAEHRIPVVFGNAVLTVTRMPPG